jgi:hypothetical protein
VKINIRMSTGTLKPTNNKDITALNFGLPSDAARKFVLLPRISGYPISPDDHAACGACRRAWIWLLPIPPLAGKP